MMKRSVQWAGVVVTGLIGMTAWAGIKVTNPVNVILNLGGSGSAAGALGSARNSSDTDQYIGCDTILFSSGTLVAVCYANSAANVYGNCQSTDPDFVKTVQSLQGDSWLSFDWDSNGDCTFIHVSNASYQEPKSP